MLPPQDVREAVLVPCCLPRPMTKCSHGRSHLLRSAELDWSCPCGCGAEGLWRQLRVQHHGAVFQDHKNSSDKWGERGFLPQHVGGAQASLSLCEGSRCRRCSEEMVHDPLMLPEGCSQETKRRWGLLGWEQHWGEGEGSSRRGQWEEQAGRQSPSRGALFAASCMAGHSALDAGWDAHCTSLLKVIPRKACIDGVLPENFSPCATHAWVNPQVCPCPQLLSQLWREHVVVVDQRQSGPLAAPTSAPIPQLSHGQTWPCQCVGESKPYAATGHSMSPHYQPCAPRFRAHLLALLLQLGVWPHCIRIRQIQPSCAGAKEQIVSDNNRRI